MFVEANICVVLKNIYDVLVFYATKWIFKNIIQVYNNF